MSDKLKATLITEHYLVRAYSYTDAEATLHKQVYESGLNEFSIDKLSKEKISNVYVFTKDILVKNPDTGIMEKAEDLDGTLFFKVKVAYMVFGEDTQKEKISTYTTLVNANSPEHAIERVKQKLTEGGATFDFTITDANLTKYINVIDFEDESAQNVDIKSVKINAGEVDQPSAVLYLGE